ncbi:glycosyltransferase [Pseudonocardia sp. NPDC049154]|uniref:glycosyltransferase n=1 Tax=Pseudonocardia sp. NPDC049154 TaxID=3155501 RepID=UPI0033CBCACF
MAAEQIARPVFQDATSRRLEVLVIGMHYAPESTGNAPYTTGMARGLASAGHSVRVITGYPHYPEWKVRTGYTGLRTQHRDGDIAVQRVRHPVPAVPTASRRVLMDLVFSVHAAVLRGPRPDVVIAVSPVLLSVAAGIRWRSAGRTALGVVTQDLYCHALAETGLASPAWAQMGAQLERALLSRADGVAVIHENFARDLVELGIASERLSIIRNWSHVRTSTADPAATRKRLGWAPWEIIALHAGNMGVKQGLGNVVDAARLASSSPGGVRYVLLGAGGERRHLEEAAMGVESLDFMDPLPDGQFEDALAAADVLVLNEAPSVAAMSVPSKLTSYFASGRPIVAATASHSAASAEISRSGAGVRVDPGSPDALHAAVWRLGRDAPRGRAMGMRGLAYMRANLSPDAAAAAYCAWVESLAATRTGVGGPRPSRGGGP